MFWICLLAKRKRREHKEPRHYAKLGNGGLVFLLDPKLSARALGEYRSRAIWPPLDAAQIESLKYDQPSQPFTLEKNDNNWRVAGKPEVKVRSEAVSETLDALARLRAERFVVDAGADLKLYGLDPPLLTLDIQTGSGKRTLQIGRSEAESKRYYAHVTDDVKAAVFVIGEAEAGKIVRPLASFAAPAKPSARTGRRRAGTGLG